ncbi:MAG: hypothetical protein EOO93_17305 [Pedobacter sp.]|nr:MAG: hypothetical protein EOO93_17305 [Pedobacter sp.]
MQVFLDKMQAAKTYLDSALLYSKRSQSTEKTLDAYYIAFLVNSKSGEHKAAANFLNHQINGK